MTTSSCAAPCPSYIERTVWAGDQVLYEIRAPGHDDTTSATMEQDNPTGRLHGRVGYTHAGEIDAPVTVIRQGLPSPNPPMLAVVPHKNWQGDFEVGSWMNGTSTGQGFIQWPGGRMPMDGDLPERSDGYYWFGTLLGQKQDGSGLQYMRNRYYDPKMGRFTQEDPIGLAGGLNLYGFANGDPVNFSDPFGLCVPPFTPLCLVAIAVPLAATVFGGTRVVYNAATDQPLGEGVQGDVARGGVVGLGVGTLAAASGVGSAMVADATATAAGAAPQVGRHAGWVAEMAKRTPGEISRSIRSLERVAAQHAEWIRNPTSKAPDFYQRSAAEQASLLRQWGQTIVDRTQQANLLRDLQH